MCQSWNFILQITLVHVHKERTPVNVQSERYFQDDQLTYFLLSKRKMMEKSYYSIFRKHTIIQQHFILSTSSYFIQITLGDDERDNLLQV